MSQIPSTLLPTSSRPSAIVRLQQENEALRQELQRLSELAYCDALTGLLNRRALSERLSEELARARRSGESLSVVAIDLNGFKALNDTWGHQVGDEALQVVAQRLKATVRASDSVYRLGGDEFLVLMPQTSESNAQRALERLRGCLGNPSSSWLPRISLALGAATWAGGTESAEAMLARADAAMYTDKAAHHSRTRGAVGAN